VTYNLFHHHGDAFITLYTEIPESLDVSHASTLTAGVPLFTVTANDSSVIALTVDGEIIGVAEGTGSPVAITIPPQIPGSMMKVTITKSNYYRYVADVPVASGSYPYVMFSTGIFDDTVGGNGDGVMNPGETIDYGVWAKNVGTGTAQGVYGTLTVTDPLVTVTTDSSWYGDILENDSVLSNPYYNFSIDSSCQNNHTIQLTIDFHDINDSVFTSYKTITVYAPILVYQDVSVVNDENSNGILDIGETGDLVVTIENEGGAVTDSVTSTLTTTSSYITIQDGSGNFGILYPDSTANNALDPYTVSADSTTPSGTVVDFQVEIVYGMYVDTFDFSLVVGKKHYYIWNPDPTGTPGQNMHTTLSNLGYSGDYNTTLAADLILYEALFVCVGIFSNNYVITSGSAEAAAIVDFLQNQNGCVYLEGGDVWYYDPQYQNGYNFGPLFGINPASDGGPDLYTVAGQSGTFTEGMSFSYGGENSWIDHINPTGTGFLVFRNPSNNDNIGVANDPGTYKTVGTSFELGLLTDATPPSTREVLLDSIMHFFGIGVTGIAEEASLTDIVLKTELSALYPNPSIRAMHISYQIARETVVSLQLYDVAGRSVCTLASGVCQPGHYTVIWDGKDDLGRAVASGVYFVRFEAGDYKKVEKAVLLR
ncbi:MAG: T9SS type A sorting domain-containing protein, partial [candidate division WOR-3 bacterium]